MEEQGYIEVRVSSRDGSLSPNDVDINDIRGLISDVETFLFPTKEEKRLRPQISYDIENGSVKHRFFLPISFVILFNGLTSEISTRRSIDFLDQKRQEVIDRFQQQAIKDGYTFEFSNSISVNPILTVNNQTEFAAVEPQFVESEFYLYGEIFQEGGKSPNIHISTSRHGNLTVSATKEQIIAGEKRTYKPYGIKVSGKKSLADGKLTDLKLIEFIDYRPAFDRSLLAKVIERAKPRLSRIKNVDKWIEEMKAEEV